MERVSLNLELSKVDKQNIIGKGGFGEIYPYKGKNDPEGLKSVVKCIHAKSVIELLIIIQEVIISFNNPHPGIISSSGYCTEVVKTRMSQEFKLWIRMPRMKQNLADFVKEIQNTNKSLSSKEVVKKSYTLVSALAYLHKRKIAHRDIKPSNILLDEKENTVLSDVGSAVIIHDENNSKTLTIGQGTTKYMAPEILEKKGKVKGKDLYKGDVWSLGLTIAQLCLLDLNMKYEGQKERKALIEEMINKVKQIDYNGDNDETLGKILKGMLEWDHEKRLSIDVVLEKFEKTFPYIQVKKIRSK